MRRAPRLRCSSTVRDPPFGTRRRDRRAGQAQRRLARPCARRPARCRLARALAVDAQRAREAHADRRQPLAQRGGEAQREHRVVARRPLSVAWTCGLQPAICGITDELEVAPFWPAKAASTCATGALHRSRALESRPSGPPARVSVKRLSAVSGRPSSVDCRRPPAPKPTAHRQPQGDRPVQVDDELGQRRRGGLDQDDRPRRAGRRAPASRPSRCRSARWPRTRPGRTRPPGRRG